LPGNHGHFSKLVRKASFAWHAFVCGKDTRRGCRCRDMQWRNTAALNNPSVHVELPNKVHVVTLESHRPSAAPDSSLQSRHSTSGRSVNGRPRPGTDGGKRNGTCLQNNANAQRGLLPVAIAAVSDQQEQKRHARRRKRERPTNDQRDRLRVGIVRTGDAEICCTSEIHENSSDCSQDAWNPSNERRMSFLYRASRRGDHVVDEYGPADREQCSANHGTHGEPLQ
jgi:hypothetical protein